MFGFFKKREEVFHKLIQEQASIAYEGVSSAIIVVGSSERASKVRWSVAEEIVTAWLITIPVSALLAAGVYWLFHLVDR